MIGLNWERQVINCGGGLYLIPPARGCGAEYPKSKGLLCVCGILRGDPLAPHTIFTQYLDDEQPEQREQGLAMGRDLMWRCDDLWVVGNTISSGMREEIELAKKLYMPIFYVPEEQVQEKVKIRQQDRLLGVDDCIAGSDQSSYEGQILVLKPEAYGNSMDLTADDSLWYARDGFGCTYGARGQAVYAEKPAG